MARAIKSTKFVAEAMWVAGSTTKLSLLYIVRGERGDGCGEGRECSLFHYLNILKRYFTYLYIF